MRNFCITLGFPCGFTVSAESPVYFGRKSNIFLFQVHSLVQNLFKGLSNSWVLIEGLSSKRKREKMKKEEKKESKNLL